MGTPAYARVILSRLPRHEVLVVTNPDVRVGRRQILTPSETAQYAEEFGYPVVKPDRLRDVQEQLTRYASDYILTAAYGKILPPWLLALPRFGAYNLHASLLPRWRGANPIAWAIRAGDTETGVTLMEMDRGLDTGPVVGQRRVTIEDQDTTGSLTEKLAQTAAELWLAYWDSAALGALGSQPQDSVGVTWAPKFGPEEQQIDWHQTALNIERWIRSMSPDPGTYTKLHDRRIKILSARVATEDGLEPGVAILRGNQWIVGTGSGTLDIGVIQPAGRRPMTPGDYMRGLRMTEVARFQWGR